MAFKTISIIGFGLLGASLGLALKNTPYKRVCWARRSEVRDWAIAHDAADESCSDVEAALDKADLTVFALPIPPILEFLEKYASCWKKNSVVTDMGSVKGVICAKAEQCLTPQGVQFIGSHPMAGTEKSGCENAFPTLYNNADVFVCPGSIATDRAIADVEEFWRSVCMKPVRITPSEHDLLVAHTSHVLHVVASGLAMAILEADSEKNKALRFAGCATGFRDTSRIASSNPAMWREIIEYNTPAVLEALTNFEKELAEYRKIIENGKYDQFEQAFANGKELRDAWLKYKGY